MPDQLSIFDVSPEASVKEWEYDEDNDNVLCRCPVCGGRLIIGLYSYMNYYRYCPYCGEKLNEGQLTKKRVEVYRTSLETELHARDEIRRLQNEISKTV